MKKFVVGAALVAAGVAAGFLTPMVFGESAIEAQNNKGDLGESVMDATKIRERIKEIKGKLVEGDESLEQLKLRSELKTLTEAIERDGDKAKIYVYDGKSDAAKTRTLLFEAKSLESGLALRAAPESFEIVNTEMGLMLLDSRTGDTWVYKPTTTRGNYWEPLPRSAERYHIVPRNYAAEAGFQEFEAEHRHRRDQIKEMMEELHRELEEMKVYEKR